MLPGTHTSLAARAVVLHGLASIDHKIVKRMTLLAISLLGTAALHAQDYPCGAGTRGLSFDQYAAEEARRGQAQLTQARTFEAAGSATADPAEQARYARRTRRAYRNAAWYFGSALNCDRRQAPVWFARGLALRKLDRLDESLAAYQGGLTRAPDDPHGQAGQAETALALGEYETVRETYLALRESAPEVAGELLVAMQLWAAGRADDVSTNQGSISAAADFAAWIRAGAQSPPRR